ncbi:YjaG family protein [Avibacterium sp. 21-599]|uniref:YjaG family protein n=1 Tax=Avibacterium sp. 21-599 TaxID=2911528 RepID=UPI002247EFDB|nr:DUF416 family protein [Avibacterium sp. 21-599]MCW9718791.1 DUF416 family protein [Avibacterium sp. 21-599]
MRNPIHKRLEHLASWQHITFMACLCERMLPNFQLFCQVTELPEQSRIYQNILNLTWEYLTVKGANINFDNQLEKFEAIIPDVNNYDFYGVVPAINACEALSELLHSLIAGETLEHAVQVSLISLQTVTGLLEMHLDRELSEQELKASEEIEQELDVQWQIYRTLRESEERDISLILALKNEIRVEGISNIGIEFNQ